MTGHAVRSARISFQGFPLAGMQFFRSLARNNRREWFQPRKHIYEEQVKAPMAELVTALNAEMIRFAPDHVMEPAKAIYRIYRRQEAIQDPCRGYLPTARHREARRRGSLLQRRGT